jgi:hypothetical protein
MFLNSKIKPAASKLNVAQQSFLAEFLRRIYTIYNDTFRTSKPGSFVLKYAPNLEQFIMNLVDAGDNLLSTLKQSIDKLILDTVIILNTSKQLSRDGETTVITEPADNYALQLAGFVGSGRKPRKMIGCGRNFYGEKINNSKDIPTIRHSYQNCPTKYLL